jgi:ribosomal protein L32
MAVPKKKTSKNQKRKNLKNIIIKIKLFVINTKNNLKLKKKNIAYKNMLI